MMNFKKIIGLIWILICCESIFSQISIDTTFYEDTKVPKLVTIVNEDTGNPRSIQEFDSTGEKHGTTVAYQDDGSYYYVENYSHGKLHGLSIFNQNKESTLLITYNEGVRNGLYVEIFNGRIFEIGEYGEPIKDRKTKKINPKDYGMPADVKINPYEYVKVGHWRYFHDNGMLESSGEHYPLHFEKREKGVMDFGMGMEDVEHITSLNAKHGEWCYWDELGRILKKEWYKKGKLIKSEEY